MTIQSRGGGGGGGTQVQRGGGAPTLRISQKNGSFLRPPHDRDFVGEGYFFVRRYKVWGGGGGGRGVEIPLLSTGIQLSDGFVWVPRFHPEFTSGYSTNLLYNYRK